MSKREIVLRARGLRKVYPNGTVAVQDVSFDLHRGEIHAIVGENGAGKSTVMKMLYGLERPTSGTIEVRGAPVTLHSSHDAIDLKIGLVHQHLMLIDSLSVAENVVLGQEPVKGMMFDRAAARQQTSEQARRYGMDLDPDVLVGSLPVGKKQRTEILKVLFKGAEILLLDEPTAVLTPQETRELFDAIRELVALGMTVVFITHKLGEVKAVADRVTVMRGGKVTGEVDAADVTPAEIAAMMVGRELSYAPAPRRRPEGDPLVEVEGLTWISPTGQPALDDVTFRMRRGEILGVAGVEGNGQTELAQVLAGLYPPSLGEGRLDGKVFTGIGPRQCRARGIGYIPEDRIHDGIVAEMSIEENFIANRYFTALFSRFGLRRERQTREATNTMIGAFGVKTRNAETPIGALSGGNMQKVVLGREFGASPSFLIAAQPTRGVDIGAAEGLRSQLVDLRDAGTAVLLISADLDEVMSLSDRIIVLYKGRIVGHFMADEADQNTLGAHMLGAAHATGDTHV